MSNIELRWVERGQPRGNTNTSQTVRVLQYRTGDRLPVGVESRHYISDGVHDSKLVRTAIGPDIAWSDWRDVPVEAE